MPDSSSTPLEHVAAVGRIVDGEVLGQPDQRGVLPQQPRTEAVKRSHPDRLAGASCSIRERISSAALLVKVSARICRAGTPWRSRWRCGG